MTHPNLAKAVILNVQLVVVEQIITVFLVMVYYFSIHLQRNVFLLVQISTTKILQITNVAFVNQLVYYAMGVHKMIVYPVNFQDNLVQGNVYLIAMAINIKMTL